MEEYCFKTLQDIVWGNNSIILSRFEDKRLPYGIGRIEIPKSLKLECDGIPFGDLIIKEKSKQPSDLALANMSYALGALSRAAVGTASTNATSIYASQVRVIYFDGKISDALKRGHGSWRLPTSTLKGAAPHYYIWCSLPVVEFRIDPLTVKRDDLLDKTLLSNALNKPDGLNKITTTSDTLYMSTCYIPYKVNVSGIDKEENIKIAVFSVEP